MTTPHTPISSEGPTAPPNRNWLVPVLLGMGVILVAATAYWSLSSKEPEQTDEASDVWVGNGWESTKIPTEALPAVLSEIDRYRVRLDTDPEYREADFYTDLFHANTLNAYRDMVDYYYDGAQDFYEIGKWRADNAEVYIHSCGTLDAFLHLHYVSGSEAESDIEEGEEEAGVWQGEVGGRLSVDRMLHAIAIFGDDELQEIMDSCGLNDLQ